jgi:TonB family protein
MGRPTGGSTHGHDDQPWRVARPEHQRHDAHFGPSHSAGARKSAPAAADSPAGFQDSDNDRACPERPQPSAATKPSDAKGRTPVGGPELQEGTAIVETGAKGAGFGLSSGGGSGTGGYLDVGDFCCPEYLVIMQQLIRRNWNEKQQTGGEAMVKFTITRDGIITDVALERSSGFAALDLESQRALLLTRQLPALPAQFPDSKLTVHLRFQYQRS